MTVQESGPRVKKNGWVDPYPHADFDSPCSGPCCVPEAYGPPPHWRCDYCDCPLMKPGACEDCAVEHLDFPKEG